MIEDPAEFAAHIEPSKHVIHVWADTATGGYWHSVRMTPYHNDITYVLSKYQQTPRGVFTVRQHGKSRIHYVITSEA